jgi:hypothetical protein
MSAQACPGNCNSRWHKARRAYDAELAGYDPLNPDTSRPEPPDESLIREWGNPVWCSDHASAIGEALAELNELSANLAAAADGQRGQPQTQRVGGTSVVLSQSEIHDQLDDLTSALTGWERAWRDLNGWRSAPRRGSLARVQTSCIDWLCWQLPDILASEIAADFGREVLEWKPALTSRAKAGQRTILLEARCPGHGCGQRLLVWKEGTDRVECQNRDCGTILSKQAYDDLAAVQAEQHKALFHRGRECDCHLRRTPRIDDLDMTATARV